MLEQTAEISIHAPREGSDPRCGRSYAGRPHFYPRSPRGERRAFAVGAADVNRISIHAPREGSDGKPAMLEQTAEISIHAPREGSDPPYQGTRWAGRRFLSTLPARGATIGSNVAVVVGGISIHAPREGSDPSARSSRALLTRFLSTLPARGATTLRGDELNSVLISIHAPREGSDPGPTPTTWKRPYFYPRSPRGERPSTEKRTTSPSVFLSTLPARGATACRYDSDLR